MSQLTLGLDAPAPRRTRRGCRRAGGHHEHSARAYRDLEERGLTTMQQRVLQLIAALQPVDDNGLIAAWVATGGNVNTPRARRVELADARCVDTCGERNGRALWRVTPLGSYWMQRSRAEQ